MLLQNKKAYRYADFDHMRSLFNFFRKGGGVLLTTLNPRYLFMIHTLLLVTRKHFLQDFRVILKHQHRDYSNIMKKCYLGTVMKKCYLGTIMNNDIFSMFNSVTTHQSLSIKKGQTLPSQDMEIRTSLLLLVFPHASVLMVILNCVYSDG